MGFRRLCRQTLGICLGNQPVAKHAMAVAVTIGLFSIGESAFGQGNGFFRQPIVGGVRIDADGVMRSATVADQNQALSELRETLVGPQGELQAESDTRLISLKNLQDFVIQARKNNTAIPEETPFPRWFDPRRKHLRLSGTQRYRHCWPLGTVDCRCKRDCCWYQIW
jgi:hypothetical protein